MNAVAGAGTGLGQTRISIHDDERKIAGIG